MVDAIDQPVAPDTNFSASFQGAPVQIRDGHDLIMQAGTGTAPSMSSTDSGDIVFKTNTLTQLARIWTDGVSASNPLLYLSTGDLIPDLAIDSTGNVGIGTPSPSYRLDVRGQANVASNMANVLKITALGAGYADAVNGVATIYSENTIGPGGNVLKVGSAYAPYGLVVKDNGRVGIGTTAPGTLLEVAGVIHAHDVGTVPDNAYQGIMRITRPAASGQYINLIRAGVIPWSIGTVYNSTTFGIGQGQATDSNFTAPFFNITSTGNVGIGTTTVTELLTVDGNIDTTLGPGGIGGTNDGSNQKRYVTKEWVTAALAGTVSGGLSLAQRDAITTYLINFLFSGSTPSYSYNVIRDAILARITQTGTTSCTGAQRMQAIAWNAATGVFNYTCADTAPDCRVLGNCGTVIATTGFCKNRTTPANGTSTADWCITNAEGYWNLCTLATWSSVSDGSDAHFDQLACPQHYYMISINTRTPNPYDSSVSAVCCSVKVR